MESQPNEIITHILSYTDNRELMLNRRVCHRWKKLIEGIFYKPEVPQLHVCILNNDYYHFAKHYLNYNYNTELIDICIFEECTRFSTHRENARIRDFFYYIHLSRFVTNKLCCQLDSAKSFLSSLFEKQIFDNGSNLHDDLDHICKYDPSHIYKIFIYAVNKCHFEVIKYLINKVNIHTNEESALRISAHKGYLEIVKYLVDLGADIHVRQDYVLRSSCEYGHLEVIKYLINKGADIHACCDEALFVSVQNNNLELSKYLISQGANIHTDYLFHLGGMQFCNGYDYILNHNPELVEYFNSFTQL